MTIFMTLRIKDAFKDDFGKGIARIDPNIVSEKDLDAGDSICIYNESTKKYTAAIIFPSEHRDKGTKIIRIDASLRRNLNASIDDVVRIKTVNENLAQQVSLAGIQTGLILKNPNILAEKLKNALVSKGDIFSFQVGNRKLDLIVINHTPQVDVVRIHKNTNFFCQKEPFQGGI